MAIISLRNAEYKTVLTVEGEERTDHQPRDGYLILPTRKPLQGFAECFYGYRINQRAPQETYIEPYVLDFSYLCVDYPRKRGLGECLARAALIEGTAQGFDLVRACIINRRVISIFEFLRKEDNSRIRSLRYFPAPNSFEDSPTPAYLSGEHQEVDADEARKLITDHNDTQLIDTNIATLIELR